MLTRKELMKKMDIKKDKVIKSNIMAVLTKIVSNDSNTGWKLVDKNGKEIKVGDTITFEGNQVKVTSLEPPHKPGANGRVSTKNATKNWTGRFYANVYGLKFVRESDATAGLKNRKKIIASDKTYKIVRFYQNINHPKEVLETGLSFEEAQEHCNDPETSSSTCEKPENIARTEEMGDWFDGYYEE